MFWCRVLILACTLGSYRELVKNIAWPCARASVLIPLGPGEAEDPAWGVLESTLGDSVRRIGLTVVSIGFIPASQRGSQPELHIRVIWEHLGSELIGSIISLTH